MAWRGLAIMRKFNTAAHEPLVTTKKHLEDRYKMLSRVAIVGGVAVVGLNSAITVHYWRRLDTKLAALESKVDSIHLLVTDLKEDVRELRAESRELKDELHRLMAILKAMAEKK